MDAQPLVTFRLTMCWPRSNDVLPSTHEFQSPRAALTHMTSRQRLGMQVRRIELVSKDDTKTISQARLRAMVHGQPQRKPRAFPRDRYKALNQVQSQ